jgi:hypothetical protein
MGAVCKYHGSSSVCVPAKVALDDVRWHDGSQASAQGPEHRLRHCQKKRIAKVGKGIHTYLPGHLSPARLVLLAPLVARIHPKPRQITW